MAMKDLMVLLEPGREDDAAGAYAISLAAQCNAHLTGASIAYEIPPGSFGVLPSSVIDTMRERDDREAGEIESRFVSNASAAGIRAETVRAPAMPDLAQAVFGDLCRHFDCTILNQHDTETGRRTDMMIEAALFRSGRAAIVVPTIQKGPAKLDRILLAWDGSEAATRALASALPLLKLSRSVQVVAIPRERGGVDLPGFNITRHLARHDVSAELKVLPSPIDAANTLLSHAADHSADLLVMGGYGHSRLRESLFGGTTREILATMTLPVLMAH
jgi:nucleotide-binding universal stress UspA family protein